MGAGLAVDLAVEELGGADLGEHAGGGAAHAHVVARAHLVAHRTLQVQVRLLDLPASCTKNIFTKSGRIRTFSCR